MKWPTVQLGRIATITGGSTPRRERDEYWGGAIPWLTPTDLPMPGQAIAEVTETASHITDEGLASCAASLLPVETVLFSSRATIGKLGIARVPVATNQGFANFIPGNAVESKYLAYCLQHYTDQIARLAGSTTFKEVTKSALKTFEVPLPTKTEQRMIVGILEQANALRQQRRAADEKAQRILPALFHKLFGDPATNPMLWPVKQLGDVTVGKPKYGANASAMERSEGKPRYVRITDIADDGRLLQEGVVTLNIDDWEPYRLVPGDVLFARSGNNVGKTYLFRPGDGLCAYAGYLIRFMPDLDQVQPWYLFGLTQTDYYRAWVDTRKRVAGQPNINGKEYASFVVPCPPVPLQQRFAELAEKFVSIRESRESTDKLIGRLFDVLLHRAFTGELTAGWREANKERLDVEILEQMAALEAHRKRPSRRPNRSDRSRKTLKP